MAKKDDFIVRDSILTSYVGLDSVVTIPNFITGIASNAFSSCSNVKEIEKIILNEKIDKLSIDAFEGLENLTKIEVDSQNKTFSSKNGVLFSKDGKALVAFPKGLKGSYLIPDKTKQIFNKSFSNCKKLTSLTIPKSVLDIDGRAFIGCDNLKTITVDRLSPYFVFIDSTLFTKDGNTLIRFFDKDAKKFEVPYCVREIGCYAFSGMNNLEELIIPSLITKISRGAFSNCTSLSCIRLLYDNIKVSDKIIGLFDLPLGINEIEDEVFYNCSSMSEAPLPFTIESIGNKSFYGCSLLREVDTSNIKRVGEEAFSHCDSLTSFNIGKDLKEIGEGALSFNKSLKSITTNEYNPYFVSDYGILYNNKTKTILQILNGQDSTFIVGEMVKRIGKGAFALCNDITNVLCSKSVTTVGKYAFENCENLSAFSFQGNLQDLGEGCFRGCLKLTELNNLGSIKEIRDEVFSSCASLKQISLPHSIQRIGKRSFNNCVNLKNVSLPDSLVSIEEGAFNNCSSITEMKTSNNMTILNSSFTNCKNLTRLTLNEGLTFITSYALYNCESLVELNLPSSLCRIGYNAFDGCSSLKEINIPSLVTFIGNYSFNNMPNLENINVKEDNEVFSSKGGVLFTKEEDSLIKFPEGKTGEYEISGRVTSLQSLCLSNITKMSAIKIPSNIQDVSYDAFDGTDSSIIQKV